MRESDSEEFARELALLRENGLKNSPLRLEYETKVHALAALAQAMRAQGCGEAELARTLQEKRRALGAEYKRAAPPLLREYIYSATAQKYGDPLGPTYEALRERKTDREIIESAARPIRDLDDRLTVDGFIEWFRASHDRS